MEDVDLQEPLLDEKQDEDVVVDEQHDLEDQTLYERKHDDYTYDYVMVFRNTEDDDQPPLITIDEIVNAVQVAGLETYLYKSIQQDEIYCLIGASERRLEHEANRIDFELRLDQNASIEAGKERNIRLATATDDNHHTAKLVKPKLWKNLYAPLELQSGNKHLYETYDEDGPCHQGSLFSTSNRLKLTLMILEEAPKLGGAGLSIDHILNIGNSPMLAFFPLHNQEKKKRLIKAWTTWKSFFKQPINKIRSYFGEKVAIYFAFLEFYNRYLLIPALIGIVFQVLQFTNGTGNTAGMWVYALVIALWGTFFLERWKQYEAKLRVRWGMTNFSRQEPARPDFEGTWIRSPINGALEEYFPMLNKVLRMMFSQGVVLTSIAGVIASVVGVFILRASLVRTQKDYGTYYASFINSVQIQILNVIYGYISVWLNDYENHKTDSQYENALISKSFLFKFINSYNTFFYIAFWKGSTDEGCVDDNCLEELRTQLAIIFVTLAVVNNAFEIGMPYIMGKYRTRKNNEGLTEEEIARKTQAEIEFELEDYPGTFSDFDELVVQYGYVVLFVVAFPFTPLLALLNNFLELRLDARKLDTYSRRPRPHGAANIGTWYDIFNIISYIGVITNVGLSVLYSSEIVEYSDGDKYNKLWIAIIAEHVFFILKAAIAVVVPDEPEEVIFHKYRQEYVTEVMIRNAVDDEEDELDNDMDNIRRRRSSASKADVLAAVEAHKKGHEVHSTLQQKREERDLRRVAGFAKAQNPIEINLEEVPLHPPANLPIVD